MKKFSLILTAGLLVFASCKKDSTTPAPNPTPTTPTATQPTNIAGADGVLGSIQFVYTVSQMGFDVDLESEVGFAAMFQSRNNANTFVDAGAISLNSIALERQSNNTYVKTAMAGLTPSTFNMDSQSTWNVGGGNGHGAFNYTHTGTFPSVEPSALPSEINSVDGFTLNLSSAVSGMRDSIVIQITGSNKSVAKTVAGNASSINFSAAEVKDAGVTNGNTGFLQIAPYSFIIRTLSGKDYAFVKEYAYNKFITIK